MSQLAQVLIAFLAVSVVSVSANAYSLQYKGNMKHPDLENHCYYPEYKLSVAVNEVAKPTDIDACIQVFCREDYVLEIKHCGNLAPNLACTYAGTDYSKPYPSCCPVVTCGDNKPRYEEEYNLH